MVRGDMIKKRILIVAPFPPPFGGIARYVQDLWDSEVLNSRVHLYRIDTSRGEKCLRGEGRGDNTWSRWRMFLKPTNWVYLLFVGFNYLEFLLKMIAVRPQIVHVHTCSYFGFLRSGLFLFLGGLFPCRRILHLHNAIDLFYSSNANHPFWRKAIRWSLCQADELVVLSEGLRTWVKENLGREATVIWNACYSKKYRSHDRQKLEQTFPEATGRIVVLMLGGLHEYKGAFDLLEVINDLSAEEQNSLLFLIPGRGDIERAKTFVSKRGLEKVVLLPGVVSEEIKDDLLRGADVFVLPSYTEGQPIAILEAMSASLPVIATNVGSIAEIVDDGKTGYLINPGDKELLKQRLLHLARDEELRAQMGRGAQQRISLRHDIQRLFEATAKLYVCADL